MSMCASSDVSQKVHWFLSLQYDKFTTHIPNGSNIHFRKRTFSWSMWYHAGKNLKPLENVFFEFPCRAMPRTEETQCHAKHFESPNHPEIRKFSQNERFSASLTKSDQILKYLLWLKLLEIVRNSDQTTSHNLSDYLQFYRNNFGSKWAQIPQNPDFNLLKWQIIIFQRTCGTMISIFR